MNSWSWAVLAVVGTDATWSFKQDEWENWWARVEAVFRTGDQQLHPLSSNCCEATRLFTDLEEPVEEYGGDCFSFRVPVPLARDRLAAMGANVRDASARLANLDLAYFQYEPELVSLISNAADRTASDHLLSVALLAVDLQAVVDPLDVFAIILSAAPTDGELLLTSVRGEHDGLLREPGFDPLASVLHTQLEVTTTVLLTEGAFDQEVLAKVFEYGYPHLHDYVRFIDSELPQAERGVNGLVAFVRALVSAGVRAPNFVAVFDNDTEGLNAANQLTKRRLPTGYRVCTLPRNEDLTAVSVRLPGGTQPQDVNGWGAPIELYLALDLGLPLPTLWLSRTKDGYQGVIDSVDKSYIQKTYRAASSPPGPALRGIVESLLSGNADLQPPDTLGERLPVHPQLRRWGQDPRLDEDPWLENHVP